MTAEIKVVFKNIRKQAKKISWHQLNTTLDLGLEMPVGELTPLDLWDADRAR